MKNQPIKNLTSDIRCADIEGYAALEGLALDLLWAWSHKGDVIWEKLDPALWELTRNPWVVLQTISHDKLKSMMDNAAFRKTVDEIVQTNKHEFESPTWYQKKYPQSQLKSVAYFSMEFMLSEALPIYSGGLGNVAGDQLKTASDLGVPVSAVGLLYQQGYFRQMVDKNGYQQALFPYNDPGQLPIRPLRKNNGEWLRLEVVLPGYSVWLRTWQAKVGRVNLYLLDSNDAANYPTYRGITSELYGGTSETRLAQEMILGIGGWRLLEALEIKPQVCHLNEGHAAFAVLERAHSFMKENNVSFEIALEATRAGNLFTTHTAVPAGFDRFSPSLMEQYFSRYIQRLGISMKELLALGRVNGDDNSELFNMAYLAVRGSGAINGVSRLHGKVSRQLFEPLFPHWSEDDIPVSDVTNGVHMPTWDSEQSDILWTEACGKHRWLEETENLEKSIRAILPSKIWQMRNTDRKELVEFARRRLSRQLAARGASTEDVEKAKHVFDPNTLTLGFARRFAIYKRTNILLTNPERLLRILTNAQRPVQLIFAGKAHPADKPGQDLIHQWMEFINRLEVRSHVIYLTDYDMSITENLVKGVDVWINTPRRPWEACGTSGMKVLVNGGLNLSELDGWWAEAYTPEVGWAIGDGKEHGEDPSWDIAEANVLYDILENQVIPEFYNRDQDGIPLEWVNRIQESMALLTPRFSANRSVRQYTEEFYIPAANEYLERSQNKGDLAKQILQWKHHLAQDWGMIRFCEVKVTSDSEKHFFEALIYLDDLNPDSVEVQLFADEFNNHPALRQKMERKRELIGNPHSYLYQAAVPASRPVEHYTPRVIPYHSKVSVPLEASEILWQH